MRIRWVHYERPCWPSKKSVRLVRELWASRLSQPSTHRIRPTVANHLLDHLLIGAHQIEWSDHWARRPKHQSYDYSKADNRKDIFPFHFASHRRPNPCPLCLPECPNDHGVSLAVTGARHRWHCSLPGRRTSLASRKRIRPPRWSVRTFRSFVMRGRMPLSPPR
jgi:hypothetical protein